MVLVTSGPGATNAITGITNAYIDIIPMVVLTGQVADDLVGTDAFQECDGWYLDGRCTKHSYHHQDPDRLGPSHPRGLPYRRTGRPGPVVIDIPKNMQVATGTDTVPGNHRAQKATVRRSSPRRCDRRRDRHDRRRPSALSSTRVAASINAGPDASAALHQLVSLPTPGHIDPDGPWRLSCHDPQWLGMLGMHGRYTAT